MVTCKTIKTESAKGPEIVAGGMGLDPANGRDMRADEAILWRSTRRGGSP